MLTTSLAVLLSLCALVGACKKTDPVKPTPAPVAVQRPIPPPPAAGPSMADAKVVLTEDKLARFARFQTAMLAATAEANNLALTAPPRAGDDAKKVDLAPASASRAERIAAANKAALAKTGLTQDEANKLSRIVTPYYGRLFAMHSGLSRTAEMRAKAAGATGRDPADKSTDKLQAQQAARMNAIRKDFGERFGEDALVLVQKHEADFFPIHEKMLSTALRGMRQPPAAPTPTPSCATPPAAPTAPAPAPKP